jgi:hypothetical protein
MDPPRDYISCTEQNQSEWELKEYEGVQRSSSVQLSSLGSQNSSSGVSSQKTITVCQTVICELL